MWSKLLFCWLPCKLLIAQKSSFMRYSNRLCVYILFPRRREAWPRHFHKASPAPIPVSPADLNHHLFLVPRFLPSHASLECTEHLREAISGQTALATGREIWNDQTEKCNANLLKTEDKSWKDRERRTEESRTASMGEGRSTVR